MPSPATFSLSPILLSLLPNLSLTPRLFLPPPPPFSLLSSRQGPISSHHVRALSRVGSTSGQFEVSPAAALHLSHVNFQLGLMYSAGLFNRTGSCSGSAT